MRPSNRVMRQNQVRSWKLRTDGLVWISSLNPRWRYDDGRPDLGALAADTGMSYQNLYRINRDSDWPVSNPIAVALADGAADACGLPFLIAYLRIFRSPDEKPHQRPWFHGAETAEEITEAFIRHMAAYAPEASAA